MAWFLVFQEFFLMVYGPLIAIGLALFVASALMTGIIRGFASILGAERG